MKTQAPWLIYGQPVNQDATATVHCPACGHPILDDLGIQLAGAPRWPIQGSQLTCPGCKSVGSVSYSHWVELPNLATMWADIISRLELPSTRMLLTQQAELVGVDANVATVAVLEPWLPMAQSRLPLLEKAVTAVLPGHKTVLRPTALQSAAAPQLQEAVPPPESEKVGPEYPWEPGLPLVQEPAAATVVITEVGPHAPAPVAPLSPAPAAVESATTIPVFERGQEPRGRVVGGVLHLSLTDWRKLLPAFDDELRRAPSVIAAYRQLFHEEPPTCRGSAAYSPERLGAAIYVMTGVVSDISFPKWRIREDSATTAA